MIPAAIILCGGHSQRMRRPKAWLPFGPELMLPRVVRLVTRSASPIVVVSARGQSLPDLPDDVWNVPDARENRGPLQGIEAGLSAMNEDVTLVYITATDLPFLAQGWIDRLIHLISDYDIALPTIDGVSHPFAAVYRRATVLPVVQSLLNSDVLRVLALRDRVRVREIGADALRDVDPDLQTTRNVNTEQEYRDALRDAGFQR